MNEIVNNFLLTGDNFIPELQLRQLGFTYSVCGPFTKHCEKIQIFIETGNLKRVYKKELDKACFAHDAANSDSKNLAKRTASDKIFKDRAYKISRNAKYDGNPRGLANMVYTFFIRKQDHQQEKCKWSVSSRITRESSRNVYARFKNNIWAADLAEMGSLSSFNRVKYLLSAIDFSAKYAWVKPLKDKKAKTVLHAVI